MPAFKCNMIPINFLNHCFPYFLVHIYVATCIYHPVTLTIQSSTQSTFGRQQYGGRRTHTNFPRIHTSMIYIYIYVKKKKMSTNSGQTYTKIYIKTIHLKPHSYFFFSWFSLIMKIYIIFSE